ncbi:MAG: hypothetical protein AAGI14_00080 [Pseudomonadota bacterium]
MTNQIEGQFELDIIGSEALFVEAQVMGVTCSARATSGDFQDRFAQIAESNFETVFDGTDSGTYSIQITPTPDQPKIMQLRRSYMTGVARAEFAIGADVTVSPPSGEAFTFTIASDETSATANSEPSSGCETNGKSLASAFDKSAILLMQKINAEMAGLD